MNESLGEHLNRVGADTDTIQQAVRYYLAERTDDLKSEEMRAQILAAAKDSEEVEEVLSSVARNTLLLERAALAVLSAAWEEPGQADRIRAAIQGAKLKLAIVEAGLLAIVATYGLYLIATGGIKRSKHTVERGADGTFKETTEIEYFSPSGPLSVLVRIFR